jgi:cyclopropane-fatty-acyl-phospholipid synthase
MPVSVHDRVEEKAFPFLEKNEQEPRPAAAVNSETRWKWPRFEMKRRVEKILSRADITIGGTREWDVTVNDERFYGRLLRFGSLGLGESYVDGWWDCPSLDQFFSRVLCADLDRNPLCNWRSAIRRLLTSGFNQQTRSRAKRVARQHYDLGNELYQYMLDHRMVYTCGRWEHATNLDEAQEAKLDFVCRRLGLQPGMTLLDIGCGWGSLAKFAAQVYGATVFGITLSRQQMHLAREMCKGLPVQIRLRDYRDVYGTFDCVASLGMFEHVGYKNYRRFFETVHGCLRPGGLFFLSTIGSNDSFHVTDPWIDKYIFPNAYLPSAAQITKAMEGLFQLEDWENWAPDYERTTRAWFQNFQGHWGDLESRYGARFYRMWKYYLMGAAASFRARRSQVWQILMVGERELR